MTIVRWSPANDLASLHSAMDRLLGDVFGDYRRQISLPGDVRGDDVEAMSTTAS